MYVKQVDDEDKVKSLMTTLNLAMCSRDCRCVKITMMIQMMMIVL